MKARKASQVIILRIAKPRRVKDLRDAKGVCLAESSTANLPSDVEWNAQLQRDLPVGRLIDGHATCLGPALFRETFPGQLHSF